MAHDGSSITREARQRRIVRCAAEPAASPRADSGLRTPIDHVHLARYTMGNRQLEREVLGLFADQAPETLAALDAAHCAKSWHLAAHTLKGSARAVGAWELAAAAEDAEAQGPLSPARGLLIARLEQALDATARYIDGLPATV